MFSAFLICPVPERLQVLRTAALETRRLLLARILEEYPLGIPLLRLLNIAEPEIVLIDVVDWPLARQCSEEIRERFPQVPILGFGPMPPASELRSTTVPDAILAYPTDPDLLTRCVDEWLQRLRATRMENLYAFLPAKAGSGATTVVWHTAQALAGHPGHRTLVIEADFHSGPLSFMVNAEPEESLQALMSMSGEMDALHVERAIVRVEKVELLLSGRTEPERTLRWEDYFRLLDVVGKRYGSVLVDLPEQANPEARQLLRRASKVVVVSTPDVVALKLAEKTIRELAGWGVDQSRIRLVLNRWEKGDVTARDVEKALGHPVEHAFPNDSLHMKAAVLLGSRLDPKTELAKSFAEFATKLRPAA